MPYKILIMGRARSGKDQLAIYLQDAMEAAGQPRPALLKTCTTRPRRTPDEDGYHFHTPEEAAEIPDSRKLFYTEAVDGYARWADLQAFLDSDIAVLDATALQDAAKTWRDAGNQVYLAYVEAPDATRLRRWLEKNAYNKNIPDVLAAWDNREQCEGPQFSALERCLKTVGASGLPQVDGTYRIANRHGLDGLKKAAGYVTDHVLADMDGKSWKRLVTKGQGPIEASRDSWQPHEWQGMCRFLGISPERTTAIRIRSMDIEYTYEGKEGEAP